MRRRVLCVVAIAVFVAGLPAPAGSHEASVTICIPSHEGGPCFRGPTGSSYEGEGGPSYYFGDIVVVRGHVRPQHDGRVEIQRRKAPEYEIRRFAPDFPLPLWETVAEVRIGDDRRYRYTWQTRRRDADQGRPYQFRVRLNGHGQSRIQEVYVLFGE